MGGRQTGRRRQRLRLVVVPRLHLALVAASLLAIVAGVAYARHLATVSWAIQAAVSGKVVVIDPGHGGDDPGTLGVDGVLEKDVTLPIAQRLREVCGSHAVYALLTRTTDANVAEGIWDPGRRRDELQARADLANRWRADVFISVHANSFPESYWHGAQTFHYPGDQRSRRLAVAIQQQLVKRHLTPDYREALPGRYYVLHQVQAPAVLVEVGFLSNPQESRNLQDPAYQRRLADAIFAGLVDFWLAERRSPDQAGMTEPRYEYP